MPIVSLKVLAALAVCLVSLSIASHALYANSAACGPPVYCARTDRKIEPYAQTPPPMGPAGTIIRDPTFGSRILRVTDGTSEKSGRSFMTPGNAQQNSWNADGTKFYVLTPTGQYALYDFDPATMKAKQDGILKVKWLGAPEFSFVRPSLLFGVRYQNPAFRQYDTTSRKFSTIHEVSDCVKIGANYGFSINVSADDARFSTQLGPGQDKNNLIYVYDRKLGCRWYNTQTGEIGGQWGPKGTVGIADRYSIHNSKMSKSGEFIWIERGFSRNGKNWLIWDVGTMSVVACASQCSGHHAMGYSHMVGPSGRKHPLDLMIWELKDVANPTPLLPGLDRAAKIDEWFEQHYSWNHVDPGDSTPFCLSTYSGRNPTSPGAPLHVIVPWENEILCVEADGKEQKVWRFAHTYCTAKSGFWSTPRGNESQDGRFFMFTSDWQGQLGERPTNRSLRRFDVFIVELR